MWRDSYSGRRIRMSIQSTVNSFITCLKQHIFSALATAQVDVFYTFFTIMLLINSFFAVTVYYPVKFEANVMLATYVQ